MVPQVLCKNLLGESSCSKYSELVIWSHLLIPLIKSVVLFGWNHPAYIQPVQIIWSHADSNKPQLHSPSPLLAPKCGFHLKNFLCGLLQGAERKERDGERNRRLRSGGRFDLFEQSGCNESSQDSLEVGGQSE